MMERILLFFDASASRQPIVDGLGGRHDLVHADGPGGLAQPVDLCLVDVAALDGHRGAIEARRRAEAPAHLPVLLVASRDDAAGVRQHLGVGFDDVLWLPLEPLELDARVGSLLRARVAQRALAQQLARCGAQMHDAREQLHAAHQTRAAFLNTVSHELRTPMNSIVGFTSVMLRGMAGPLTDEQRRQLEIVRTAGRRMLAQINDQLDLARLEAGLLMLRHEPFELEEVLDQALVTVAPQAQARGLTLVPAIDADLAQGCGRLLGDAHRVRQIVLHLLSNAVMCAESGTIVVRASCAADRAAVRIDIEYAGIAAAGDAVQHQRQPVGHTGATNEDRCGDGGPSLMLPTRLALAMGGRLDWRTTQSGGGAWALALPRSSAAGCANDATAAEQAESR